MKSIRANDGEWFPITFPKWEVACCDCGLAHRLEFIITTDKRGRVRPLIRATQLPSLTRKMRKAKPYQCKPL